MKPRTSILNPAFRYRDSAHTNIAATFERERRRHLSQQLAETAVRIDERGLASAETGLELVGTRLAYLLNEQTTSLEAEQGRSVDARELAALGLAGKRFLEMKAHVLGQPLSAPGENVDELERQARIEDRRLAEALITFIAQRAADEAADEVDDP